jgi:glycerophosphoryl diester phosphodiesterase
VPASERPVVVAHRGSSFRAAEHTLGAYVHALDSGADALECDVRLTRDGHLVCVHDRTVDRTSDGRGVVSEFDLEALASLDFSSWHRELPDSADELVDNSYLGGVAPDRTETGGVLTLNRLLELVSDCGRPMTVFVETKHPTRYKGLVERQLVRTLRAFGLVPGGRRRGHAGQRAVVMSFAPTALRRVRLLEPLLPVVQLREWPVGRPAHPVVVPGGVPILGPAVRLLRADPGIVRRAHARGQRIYTWTINDPGALDFVLSLGVDYIATDRPADVRARLDGRPAAAAGP